MTLNRLHKLLGELIAQGHGRRKVYVDKSSFRDNRESDGVCIMPVCEIDVQTYELADDDGGWALDARGCVKTRTSLVIYGDSRDRAAHETSATKPALRKVEFEGGIELCSDCPPANHPTNETRCDECPRRPHETREGQS